MRNTPTDRRRLRRSRSRGAALLEMVVVFMVLFYLVMGGVEYGWFMYAKHMVQSAARDGARAGIIGTATHVQANAAISDTMTSAGFGATGYTITYQRLITGADGVPLYLPVADIAAVGRGEGLRVTVTAPFSAFGVHPLAGMPGSIPATKAVTGVTTMVRE